MGSLVTVPPGVNDHRDIIILSLETENRDLKEQLREAQGELAIARNANGAAVSRLRAQLAPLYQALQAVFGEMAAFDDVPVSTSAPQNDKKRAVWESWKQNLPGKRAEFIQALLDHGEMTSSQLKVATHSGTSTVPQVIYELNRLGLIQKNGSKYSLKEL